mmetsp:Transcript_99297/g.263904  ORF Transcript_99297/g.263904 Transcript_99297/m.263904 type:complete len:254 (+) Transcript_99297:704-1465(+)
MEAAIQGMPMPRKTFTELLPVTFTIEASAHSSCFAAVREAKRSGTDVPSATKEMAVISSSTPAVHPKSSARSPMMTVIQPMCMRENQKQIQPPISVGGGVSTAKMICHGNHIQCRILSPMLGCASSSSLLACTNMASMIASLQMSLPSRISWMLTRPSTYLQNLERGRLSPGSSLTTVTVIRHLSSPPSLSGLISAPPWASSITSCKESSKCPGTLGRIVRMISALRTPSRNCSSPSNSSKSYPDVAVNISVL